MIKFGGVPIGVKTPPIDAEYAVINIKPVAYLYSDKSISRPLAAIMSLIEFSKPKQIGNIIAAVAVLLTQPEQSAVASPIAKKILRGLEPTQFLDKSQYAKRLSSPCIIIALAKMNPPINKNIIGLENAAKAADIGIAPVITARVGPISDVTGIGTGSVIHQSATSTIIAKSLCASSVRASIGVKITAIARIGATTKPKVRRFLSNACSASFIRFVLEFLSCIEIRFPFMLKFNRRRAYFQWKGEFS